MIMNTVWQASLAPHSLPLGAAANFNAKDETYFPSASTSTTITLEIPVYISQLFVHQSFVGGYNDITTVRHCRPNSEVHSDCSGHPWVCLHHDGR